MSRKRRANKVVEGEAGGESLARRLMDLELLNTRLVEEREDERAEAETLREVLDRLPFLVLIRARDGEVLLANRAVEEAYRGSLENLREMGGLGDREARDQKRASEELDSLVCGGVEEALRLLESESGEELVSLTNSGEPPVGLDPEASLSIQPIHIELEREDGSLRPLRLIELPFRFPRGEQPAILQIAVDEGLFFTPGEAPREPVSEVDQELLSQVFPDFTSREVTEDFLKVAPKIPDQPVAPEPHPETAEGALLAIARDEMGDLRSELDDARKQIQRASESLERARREKSELLSYAGNEIRIPLDGILGLCQLLESSPLQEKQQDFVDSLYQHAQTLDSVVRGIVEITSLDHPEGDECFGVFDLHDVLRRVTEELGDLAARRDILLLQQIPPGVPRVVEGDTKRLKALLSHLLETSIRFTRMGEVELKLELAACLPSGPTLRFLVHHTGDLFPPELAEALEADPGAAHHLLGGSYNASVKVLLASQKLALEMDGSVQLEQGEGYGSTLSVILPLRWAQRSPGEVKAPEEEAAGVQATNHRILLVDDNATYLELTAAMLERLGFAPELALDGQEALQQLRRNRYGVIFMDLEMPVMDGLAATRELRALEAGTDHRSVVIGVSSYARPQSVGQCLEAGMDELLRKPLDLKALEGVLSRYMGEGERRVVVRHTVPVSSDRARFDPQFLVDQFQDDVPQVYEILETFLEDVFTFRKRLEKMMRTRSMDDLGELGRVLKEVAGNVGAHSLASLGVEFQRIRCNPEAGALAVALEDLKSELEWLTGELQGGNEAAAPRRPRPRKDP